MLLGLAPTQPPAASAEISRVFASQSEAEPESDSSRRGCRSLPPYPRIDLQMRHYREVPVWRTLRFDETVMVSSFDSRWESYQSPIVVPTPDGMLHRGFRRAFEVVWEEGESWSKPS
jgi:hypothetical protein